MVKDWLLEKIRGHALHAGRKEVEKFVAGLAAMDDRDLGVIVAVATAIRVNFETYGVIPEDLFSDHDLPSVEAMGSHQMEINRLARKFTRMGRPVDSTGAMVWSYSLRCLNVPELRLLGRRMWSELNRGFGHVEAALEDGEAEKGEPFPERVWREWSLTPVGLEPE